MHRSMLALAICLPLLLIVGSVKGQEARLYVTSEAGDRIKEKPAVRLHPARTNEGGFVINESAREQEMVGFGASFLESGMMCLNSLSPQRQDELLKALFDAARGAGFSAMKTVIGATDFMAAGPFYTYDDHAGDTAMKFFFHSAGLTAEWIDSIHQARQPLRSFRASGADGLSA